MANSYYDEAGTLVLAQLTPVITAFFGKFDFGPTLSDTGEVDVVAIAEGNAPTWDDLHDSLEALAAGLGLCLPAGADDAIEAWLDTLAAHFGCDSDPALRHAIDHLDFQGSPRPALLYRLARHFDDGHGLKAIKIEGCWHGEKARPFEFGGDGYYSGRHFTIGTSSRTATELGADVDNALDTGDVGRAARLLARHLHRVLAGIADPTLARPLRAMVVESLAGDGDAAQGAAQSPASAIPDGQLSAEQLEQKYSPAGNGEHPFWLREDWRTAVANEDTVLGYWPWLWEKLRDPDY